MRGIYVSIVLLVLYGDLVKRYLPPQESLLLLYALAVMILFAIVVARRKYKAHHVPLSSEGRLVNLLAVFLVVIYLFQLFTSFSPPLMDGLTHAMYMSVPLLYIVVVQKYCPQFDLAKLGNLFLWLMIPVNCVGLVQYFVNPDFLVSTAYSGEFSGVILRNFLGDGVFARFPSIYASADRYSSVGLMQFYFSFVVLSTSGRLSQRKIFWVAFNLFSAFTALFISGARSRILIAATVLVLMAITFIFEALFSSRQKHVRKTVGKALPLFAVVLITGYVLVGVGHQDQERGGEAFPVLTFLQQSFEEGDISRRVEEAATFSFIPEEVTLFGEGLGTVGEGGKPGEFGIRSMWIESGLIWGSLLLLAFMGIVLVLSVLTYRALLSRQSIKVAVYCMPLLLVILALLAGLTSSFELSSGILLGCSIAVITRSSMNVTGIAYRHPNVY